RRRGGNDSHAGSRPTWGIPPQKKGLAESYLTTTLLGHQDNVTEILAANVENDGPGRDLVTKALGALAQDPLVMRLLKELEERCNEAYTPGGKEKNNGPLARRTREIKEQRDRLEELEKRVCRSKGIEGKVLSLTEKVNLAIDECSLLYRRVERCQKVKDADEEVGRLRAVEEARCVLEANEHDLVEKNKVIQ